MSPMSPIVGIDLGTTHSLVAICDEAGPRVLLDDQGRALLPSVVRFLEGSKTSVGWHAKNEAAQFAHATIASAKRFMGRGFAECSDIAAEMSTQLMQGPRGLAAFNIRGAAITPQEVAAVVLAELRRIAEARLHTTVTRAVITVPAPPKLAVPEPKADPKSKKQPAPVPVPSVPKMPADPSLAALYSCVFCRSI